MLVLLLIGSSHDSSGNVTVLNIRQYVVGCLLRRADRSRIGGRWLVNSCIISD